MHDGNVTVAVVAAVATVHSVTRMCCAAGGQSPTVAVETVALDASGKHSVAPFGI